MQSAWLLQRRAEIMRTQLVSWVQVSCCMCHCKNKKLLSKSVLTLRRKGGACMHFTIHSC